MAFPMAPVKASQVGTYFVGQYYQLLQNQPDFVHQFYNDASTMLRVNGNRRETADSMLAIHQLILSLKFTEIEIDSANSLESWNGGVLVVVSGSLRLSNFGERKKFVETFYLAPQYAGYFVLNDIFHFLDEEGIHQPYPISYLLQNNIDARLDHSAAGREQVFDFTPNGVTKDLSATVNAKGNGSLNSYGYEDEHHLELVQEKENIFDEHFAVRSNGSLHSGIDRLPSPVEEHAVETQKHTYASIVVKGQPNPPMASPSTLTKPIFSESKHLPEESTQQPPIESTHFFESAVGETTEVAYGMEDEVQLKSVYIRSVPKTMSTSEISDEFKKFGKLSPNSVAIRTRKEIDDYYAFVEFEDMSSVQKAIKASTVQIGEHQLHIEGRRASRYISTRGGRARGRFSYTRGRFGGHDYYRPRANGYYKQSHQYFCSNDSTNGRAEPT